jgi:hypothetical protein
MSKPVGYNLGKEWIPTLSAQMLALVRRGDGSLTNPESWLIETNTWWRSLSGDSSPMRTWDSPQLSRRCGRVQLMGCQISGKGWWQMAIRHHPKTERQASRTAGCRAVEIGIDIDSIWTNVWIMCEWQESGLIWACVCEAQCESSERGCVACSSISTSARSVPCKPESFWLEIYTPLWGSYLHTKILLNCLFSSLVEPGPFHSTPNPPFALVRQYI